MSAAFQGDVRLLGTLLAAGGQTTPVDRHGKGALVYAAGRAFPKAVAALLDAGAEADRVWGNNLTALMWVAGHANDAPEADGVAVAKLLVAAGAGMDRQDDRGKTALLIAVERNHAQMVAFLLAEGADPKITDNSGQTALDLAELGSMKGRLTSPDQ
jgi:ankyrin repeat protein